MWPNAAGKLPVIVNSTGLGRKEGQTDCTLASITGIGWLLEETGKLDEAKSYYEEARERTRRVLGDAHPATLTAIKDMGDILRNMGKLEEAEPPRTRRRPSAPCRRGTHPALPALNPFHISSVS